MEILEDHKVRKFKEFLEARGTSYNRLKKKYKVSPVSGVYLVENGKEKYLIYEADLNRVLTQWKMAYE